jgi:hypothetical protein
MSRTGRVGRWAPLAVVREPGGLIVEEQEREVSLLSVYVLVDGTKRIDRECGKRRSGGRERPDTQRLCRRTTCFGGKEGRTIEKDRLFINCFVPAR